MMADAKNNLYDIAAVWNTDRLNRHMLNAFVMLADLFKIGKDLRSATQQDLNDPDNPMRMIMYALHTWKDEKVSNGISTNVRRGQGGKAGKCHPLGKLRFGWDIAGAYIDGHGKYHSGDHYEINQREAEAVRTMYRLRARGFAWTAIARTLNEKGYKNKYGRPITDVMVAGIVRNEAYKWVYAFGHVRVEGGLPRIVADAEWDAAQDERRRMSVKHRRHVYVRPGMQFGHLQVVESAGTAKHHTKWLCECKACGSTKVEWATRLTSGKAQDCGCLSGDGRKAVSIIGTNNYPIALPYLAQDKLAPHGVCETTSVGYSHVVSVVSVRDERPSFARTARNVNVRDPLGILHDSQRLSYKHDQSFLLYLQESIVDHDCTCKHVHYVKPFICTC